MRHRKLEYLMPAPSNVVFDAFHYHHWKSQWDSLTGSTSIVGGGACPYVGAVSENLGNGLLKPLSMRTEFITYDPPRLSAAAMIGQSFPFVRWAASMRHVDIGRGYSKLIYTYTFEVGPKWLRWVLEPVTELAFRASTDRRFHRLRRFLLYNSSNIRNGRLD
jgi:Polyketide cyclase / dehydrase and lipid transport